MKHFVAALLLFVFASGQAMAIGQKTLVFDLDGVALYHVPSDSTGEHVITVRSDSTSGGDVAALVDKFRVADGFGELIQHLASRGWRISVFSFGNETRNVSAAETIKLPNGSSLLDTIKATGGSIFSNVHGRNLDPRDPRNIIDTTLPKALRPKIVKDLTSAMGAEAASNAFLIEDMLSNSAPGPTLGGRRLPGQRETNTVFLPYEWVLDASGAEVKFLEQPDGFEGAIDRGDLAMAENSTRRFSRLRNKLAYLAGLIDAAEAMVEAEPAKTLADAMQELQWERAPSGEYALNAEGDRILKLSTLDSPELMREGARLLETVPGSRYEFVLPFKLKAPCDVLWQRLDRLLRAAHSGV